MQRPYIGDDAVQAAQEAVNAVYAEAHQAVDNVRSCVHVCRAQHRYYAEGLTWDQALAVSIRDLRAQFQIPPPAPGPIDWPAMQARARVCGVRLNFQGQRINIPGYGLVAEPGGFINSFDRPTRDAIRAQELADGTHCLRQLSYNYPGTILPAGDFATRVPEFRDRLLEDLAAGLTPVVELSGDGQSYDPAGGGYGFTWLKDNLKRILGELGEDVRHACLFFHCWESLNYGGWTTSNLFDMTLLHRRLDPEAHLAWHFSYAWPGDADPDNKTGSVGSWQTEAAMAVDVMLMEGDAPFLRKVGDHWDPIIVGDARNAESSACNGWQQKARCFLGAKANTAIIHPSNRSPLYWTQPTPRGPRYAIAFEIDTYRDTHGRLDPDELAAERAYLAELGFEYIC